MKLILLNILLVLSASCAFKSADEVKEKAKNPIVLKRHMLNDNDDSDGDLVSNGLEKTNGRNPLVADIPEIRVRFLQNYKIVGEALNLDTGEIEEFSIDTKTGRDNPDFKYRVGKIFIRDEALREGAHIGRYSGHSYGEINEHDLTWIKYPDVDPRFYLRKVMDCKKYFNTEKYEIKSISAYLESTAKLKENGFFSLIKNLSVNFSYYNYEKEKYEILETKLVERQFHRGVNEVFEVEIVNIPVALVADNYLRKGEFIISEINDYEIPDLKTTYRALKRSVKAMSVPVVFNTPLESKVYYVGLNNRRLRFDAILETLYDKSFEIVDNKLMRIQQWENNLPTYLYLSEVKSLNKKGKWFVFTSRINKHFLDYEYGHNDYISLSYVVGSELSRQKSERVFSYRESANSGESEEVGITERQQWIMSRSGIRVDRNDVFPQIGGGVGSVPWGDKNLNSNSYEGVIYTLGNVSPNSEIQFQIKPNFSWGESFKHSTKHMTGGGRGSGNSIQPKFVCDYEINQFRTYFKDLAFDQSFGKELQRIKLLVNHDEFSLQELVEEKKVEEYWVEGNLHIKIKNISLIKEIADVEENTISLKLEGSSGSTFNGVKAVGMQYYWPTCVDFLLGVANEYRVPISIESLRFDEWSRNLNWGLVKYGKGIQKDYTEHFSVGISGIVNNFFN